MNKITKKPFVSSISLFGLTAFITSVSYSLTMGNSLIYSDDPYIIGFALACITAFGSFIYFSTNEFGIKFIKPISSLLVYYLLISIYCLTVEFIGGEASGYGYLFLTIIILSLPVLILFIIYSYSYRVIYAGVFSGVIYFLGYIYVLSNHM